MRLDATLALFWFSLGLSAAAVVLFLWLMRENRSEGSAQKAEGGSQKAEGSREATP